jgi:hypothetical protein
MAVITYTALAAKFRTNAAAVAAAGSMSPVTAANITGLAEMLDIMANDKSLGLNPLLKSALAKVELNPQ